MDAKKKGLYQKYRVERVDGKSIRQGCVVLEWKDPHARVGIAAFALAVKKAGYRKLASDILKKKEEVEFEEVESFMMLIGLKLPRSVFKKWSLSQREAAMDYAAKSHLRASDNPVRVPQKPWWVAALKCCRSAWQ